MRESIAIMTKKIYTTPLSEVTVLGSDILMQAFGPASMPHDQFNGAPARRVGDIID